MREGIVYNLSCIDSKPSVQKKEIKNATYWKKQADINQRKYDSLVQSNNNINRLLEAEDKVFELESLIAIKDSQINEKNKLISLLMSKHE